MLTLVEYARRALAVAMSLYDMQICPGCVRVEEAQSGKCHHLFYNVGGRIVIATYIGDTNSGTIHIESATACGARRTYNVSECFAGLSEDGTPIHVRTPHQALAA